MKALSIIGIIGGVAGVGGLVAALLIVRAGRQASAAAVGAFKPIPKGTVLSDHMVGRNMKGDPMPITLYGSDRGPDWLWYIMPTNLEYPDSYFEAGDVRLKFPIYMKG